MADIMATLTIRNVPARVVRGQEARYASWLTAV